MKRQQPSQACVDADSRRMAHARAVQAAASEHGVPPDLLEEAIAEARAVGRHRIRAVPSGRIDELITELADSRSGGVGDG